MTKAQVQSISVAAPPLLTFGERLSEERHRSFLGRQTDLALLDSMLEDPSCSALFLSGQAGVGKTRLLLEFARRSQKESRSVCYADAAEVMAHRGDDAQRWYSSHAIALAESYGSRSSVAARPVLLLDSYELLAALEPWLLGQFALGLPSNVFFVFASRQVQSPRMSLDPAWAGLTRCWQLEPWPEQEAGRFLDLREVPDAAQRDILNVVGGYPLGLVLAAEVMNKTGASTFTPRHLSEVQRTLAQLLGIRARSHAEQLALDVCSLTQTTTPALLEHVLRSEPNSADQHAPGLFDWLASQPFIERTAIGLRPHLLARLALARVQRGETRGYRAVYRPVREYVVNDLATCSQPERGFDDLFFLDRDVPFLEQLSSRDSERPPPSFEGAKSTDQQSIVELIRDLEGEHSAELARATFELEPGAFEIARDELLGRAPEAIFHSSLVTNSADLKLHARDPAARLAAQFMARYPLENGETALFFRWFLHRTDYQRPSSRVLAVAARQSHLIMSTPRLAYSLCVFRNPEDYAPLWEAASTPRQVVGSFTLDARNYSLMAFSFRERSLRDQLVDAWQVPNSFATTALPGLPEEQRGKIHQRIAALGKNSQLTDREAEILELLCQGRNFSEIAVQLGIKPRTVKFHQDNVLRKTRSSSRVELFRKLI